MEKKRESGVEKSGRVRGGGGGILFKVAVKVKVIK